jgi:hypothetical protein
VRPLEGPRRGAVRTVMSIFFSRSLQSSRSTQALSEYSTLALAGRGRGHSRTALISP